MPPERVSGLIAELERPKRPHLVKPGGGVAGEVYDLRKDIANLFKLATHGSSLIVEDGKIQSYKHNLDGTLDPDSGNCRGQGYRKGSLWVNNSSGQPFMCTDSSAGRARWKELSDMLRHNNDALVDPTAADDVTEGYGPRSRWLNISTKQEFVCCSAGKNLAVWSCTTAVDRDDFRFREPSTISVVTAVDGPWRAPHPGRIVKVYYGLGDKGTTSGSNDIDIHVGGTTIFTDQTKRPQIAFDHATGKVIVTDIDSPNFAEDDEITCDVDAIAGAGTPGNMTVQLAVEYVGKY